MWKSDSRMQQTQRLKLILLGEFGVGKTSFFCRVKHGYFPKSTLSTLSPDDFQKTYHVLHNGQPQEVEVTLWDTVGEERFDSLSTTYYRYTSAAILMYSVDRQETLEHLVHWINSARSYCDDVKLFLVGNKNDLEDKIPKDKVRRFAQEHKIQSVFKLSAKTGM
ncbi:ras-related protein Rab-10-like [Protopterus annectens]|uniref:ras-related protein Rab-10-like n=1 Tax=Protopterus annectens TaxID=7888 RepID=UPI001CF9DCF1|nr:ras-related protein Rab-10-like [Protopterus annectens]